MKSMTCKNIYKTLLRCAIFATMINTANIAAAQADFELSQRWFNESLYNPASAGNSFTTSFFLHARLQWVGMKGAPSTQAASFDTYAEPINSGFGINFMNDKLGFTNTMNARLMYAYYLPLGSNSAVSLGLSAGILSKNRNITGAVVDNETDPEFAYGNYTYISPDFDFGFEYRGPFKFGAAIRHIGTLSKSEIPKQTVNIWSYFSARFNIAEQAAIEPLASVQKAKTLWGEAGLLFYFMKTTSRDKYNDKFWVGGTYHTNNSLTLLAGVNVTPKFRFGYSFGHGLGNISHLSKWGTHEIFLAYQFNRIFYKDELCPAYRNAGVGRRR